MPRVRFVALIICIWLFFGLSARAPLLFVWTDSGKLLQERVKQMIKDSQAKGEMWTRDWDNVPLPITKLGASHDVLPSPTLPASGRPSK